MHEHDDTQTRTMLLPENLMAHVRDKPTMHAVEQMTRRMIQAAGVDAQDVRSVKTELTANALARIEFTFPATTEMRNRIGSVLLKLDVLYRTVNSHGEELPEDKLFSDAERQQIFALSPEEWAKVWEKRDAAAKEHDHLRRRHIRAALKDTLAELVTVE